MTSTQTLAEAFAHMDPGPVLVHSDISRVMTLVSPSRQQAELMNRHLEVLQQVVGNRAIYFPTFNYDFTKSRRFDVMKDRSQVGVLSEFARQSWSKWRSTVPVFSVCGLEPVQDIRSGSGQIDPFDEDSIFGHLRRARGVVLLYGAPCHSTTTIHHAERLAGGPAYRYDKFFRGVVQPKEGMTSEVELIYHVRPMGRHLEYDWARLFAELEANTIVRTIRDGLSEVRLMNVRSLCEYWVRQLQADPLYLLDAESAEWVRPELQRLGRRFRLEDFE